MADPGERRRARRKRQEAVDGTLLAVGSHQAAVRSSRSDDASRHRQ